MPLLAEGRSGAHSVCRDVTTVRGYVYVTFVTSLTSIQVYIDVYVHVSPGDNNLGAFNARELNVVRYSSRPKPLTLC